jgi:glucose-6-phosphate isomerase
MISESKSWSRIIKHGKSKSFDLRKMFRKDPQRGKDFSLKIADLNFDYSKSLVDIKTIKDFLSLAKEIKLDKQIDDLLKGELLNNTERRSVGHIWLRSKDLRSPKINGVDEIDRIQSNFLSFASDVRSGKINGHTGKNISDVVNIGIGGSDLGPAMLYKALLHKHDGKINCHFVSNIDELEISQVLKDLNPESTLFVVTSKTFTTAETLKNANYAKSWLVKSQGQDAVKNHFVAISTSTKACQDFCVDSNRIFPFWDWVGGRFSVFSSVGISLALGYGSDSFKDLQKGASEIDSYLKAKDLSQNAAFIHAIINIWNLNILKFNSLAIIPYTSSLSRFPAYLQQLWMESNGKSVTKNGKKSKLKTSPMIFGEQGTNSQHSFFQMLHQGNQVIPVDFILIKDGLGQDKEFQDSLYANALAQASVLAFGKNQDELRIENTEKYLINHKVMPGNRPSNIITLPNLEERSLGQLIGFYEASVIFQGLLLDINSFDQWGVELGKKTASKILKSMSENPKPNFDSSTNEQISNYKKKN